MAGKLEEALVTYLASQPALVALVADRIAPRTLTECRDLPMLSFFEVSRNEVHIKVGYVAPLVTVSIQFDIFAGSYVQATEVAQALKSSLYAWSQPADPVVYKCFIADEQNEVVSETKQHRRIVDVLVWYEE